MQQTLTDDEIRLLYQDKQKEDFPRRKMWLGAFYATILIFGGMTFYFILLWLLLKILN